jgi:parallel beta-helix repeat protein
MEWKHNQVENIDIHHNTIRSNRLKYNPAENIDIHHNTIYNNSWMQIICGGLFSDSCFVRNNLIYGYGDPSYLEDSGIWLQKCYGLNVTCNVISSNGYCGIFSLYSLSNNVFRNNIMENRVNAFFIRRNSIIEIGGIGIIGEIIEDSVLTSYMACYNYQDPLDVLILN